MRDVLFILLGACLVCAPGCAPGYNSVLFVTKSNFGLDVDTKPPTAEIAISRMEGVVEPTFESGETLPVMASFKPESQGLFSGNVAQTFSTGDAAAAMAVLYNAPDYVYKPTDDWDKQVAKVFASDVAVNTEPKLSGGLKFVREEPKPVFFGTATSLGVKASWSGMTASFPDSVHIGFNRKEIAAAPIAYIEDADGKRLQAPSLLATIDQAVTVGAPTSTNVHWLQYFATGRAATALTLRQDVRQAMLTRMDPKQAARFRTENVNLHVLAVVSSIANGLKEFDNAGDTTAKGLVEQLDGLCCLLPEKYEVAVYEFRSPKLTVRIPKDQKVNNIQKFAAVVKYWSDLEASKKDLSKADGTSGVQSGGVDVKKELIEADRVLTQFRVQIGKRSELTQAVQYFLSKVME